MIDKIYPDDMATETWEVDNKKFYIVHTDMGHYCGYVRLEKRSTIEQGYDGILTYVPVHGGITFANEDDDGTMVYGFDCAHVDDENNPNTWNMEWLRQECERMAIGIEIAAEIEKDYLLAKDNAEKARAIDNYHERLKGSDINFDLQDNFGAMIHLLCGNL